MSSYVRVAEVFMNYDDVTGTDWQWHFHVWSDPWDMWAHTGMHVGDWQMRFAITKIRVKYV